MTQEAPDGAGTIGSNLRSGLSNLETRTLSRLATDRSPADLRADAAGIKRHYQELVEARSRNEFLDLTLARKIVDLLQTLIAEADTYSSDQRALLNGAIRYFLLVEDHDDDMNSSIGLEDDARVTNAVAVELGKPELEIEF